jgi:hypothetical protein
MAACWWRWCGRGQFLSTPYFLAAKNNHLHIVDVLFKDSRVEVDCVTEVRRCPCMHEAMHGACVHLLALTPAGGQCPALGVREACVQWGPKQRLRRMRLCRALQYGATAVHYLARDGHLDMLKKLRTHPMVEIDRPDIVRDIARYALWRGGDAAARADGWVSLSCLACLASQAGTLCRHSPQCYACMRRS